MWLNPSPDGLLVKPCHYLQSASSTLSDDPHTSVHLTAAAFVFRGTSARQPGDVPSLESLSDAK